MADQSAGFAHRNMSSVHKSVLLELINMMLSSDNHTRAQAEKRVKAMESIREYPLHLLEIVIDTQRDCSVRQMAGVLVQRYVKANFSSKPPGEMFPTVDEDIRHRMKPMLLASLRTGVQSIASTAAYTLAMIAVLDYPRSDMTLNTLLNSFERADVVECLAVLRFIQDFVLLSNGTDLNGKFDTFCEVLYKIICHYQKFPADVRSEAIETFRLVLTFECTYAMSCTQDGVGKLPSIIHNFCMRFSDQLTLPHNEYNTSTVVSQIIKCYTTILNINSDVASEYVINRMLPTLWKLIEHYGSIHHEALKREDFSSDVDDVAFFIAAFDLLIVLLETNSEIPFMSQILPHLICYIMTMMASCESVEGVSFDDIEDEMIGSRSSLRVICANLLEALTISFDNTVMSAALRCAIEKIFQFSRMYNQSYFWRIMEAVMYAIGFLKRYIPSNLDLPVLTYLQRWNEAIPPCKSHLFVGRFMWVCGKYASIICSHPTLNNLFISTVLGNLNHSYPVLRISAVTGISFYFNALPLTEMPYGENICNLIAVALMAALKDVPMGILHMGLTSLHRVLEGLVTFIPMVQVELTNLLVFILTKNSVPPYMASDIQKIVKLLCTEGNCSMFQQTFLPVIRNLAEGIEVSENLYEAQCIAINILTAMVKFSPVPFTETLIIEGAFPILNCIFHCNDQAVIQSAADCIRGFLVRSPGQLYSFADSENRTGRDYLLNFIEHVKDPQKVDVMSMEVSRLTITTVQTLGDQVDIGSLLRSLLSKIQQTPPNTEDTVLLIFAFLCERHFQETMWFLVLIPGPQGESALNYLISKWVAKSNNFHDTYERNLCLVAWTKIIEYLLTTDAPLQVGEVAHLRHPEGAQFPAVLCMTKRLAKYLRGNDKHEDSDSDLLSDCSNRPDQPDVLDTNDIIINLDSERYLKTFVNRLADTGELQRLAKYLTKPEEEALVGLINDTPNR